MKGRAALGRPPLQQGFQRNVVDAEAGRQAEVRGRPELEPHCLAAPAREAEPLLGVVADRRRVDVAARGQRSEQGARGAPHLDEEAVVDDRPGLARRDVEPKRVVRRIVRRDAHRLILGAARVVVDAGERLRGRATVGPNLARLSGPVSSLFKPGPSLTESAAATSAARTTSESVSSRRIGCF